MPNKKQDKSLPYIARWMAYFTISVKKLFSPQNFVTTGSFFMAISGAVLALSPSPVGWFAVIFFVVGGVIDIMQEAEAEIKKFRRKYHPTWNSSLYSLRAKKKGNEYQFDFGNLEKFLSITSLGKFIMTLACVMKGIDGYLRDLDFIFYGSIFLILAYMALALAPFMKKKLPDNDVSKLAEAEPNVNLVRRLYVIRKKIKSRLKYYHGMIKLIVTDPFAMGVIFFGVGSAVLCSGLRYDETALFIDFTCILGGMLQAVIDKRHELIKYALKVRPVFIRPILYRERPFPKFLRKWSVAQSNAIISDNTQKLSFVGTSIRIIKITLKYNAGFLMQVAGFTVAANNAEIPAVAYGINGLNVATIIFILANVHFALKDDTKRLKKSVELAYEDVKEITLEPHDI